jgi:hypothetical protein
LGASKSISEIDPGFDFARISFSWTNPHNISENASLIIQAVVQDRAEQESRILRAKQRGSSALETTN